MKKNFLCFLLFFAFLAWGNFAFAQEEKLQINFFYSPSCPHCAQERPFLEEISSSNPEIQLRTFDLFEEKNVDVLKNLYGEYNVPKEIWGAVPITFIGEKYFLGYSGDDGTGKQIKEYVFSLIGKGAEIGGFYPEENEISVPILGKINLQNLSPLPLAIVMGGLDGFNACAMVALGFLLAVLVSTGTRKRVFLIGGTFILMSGAVYFLFISAWLNLFLFFSHLKFITVLVGAVIIVFSVLLLKDYFSGVVCKLCMISQEKEGFFVKAQRKLFWLMDKFSSAEMPLIPALFGVALVAVGVNMVELVCSFGFPMAFTKILSGWNIPSVSYYFYLFVYVFFYMLDDFIIFCVAVTTLRITRASEKYLKAIKLVSGVFLLLLGIAIIARPDIIMMN